MIDLTDPSLTPYEAAIIKVFLKKRLMYMNQGRGREAHGIYAAALIVWHFAKDREKMTPDIPPTDFGDFS